MSEEQSSNPNKAEGRGRRPRTHDQPIIVDGFNSVTIEFDGTLSLPHYFQISESVYTGVGLFIRSVSVRVDPKADPGSGTQCTLPGGLFAVAIEAKHPQAQDGSIIRVRGVLGGVVLSVDPGRLPKGTPTGNRKRHHNREFKIESLTFRDVITDEVIGDCTNLLPRNKKCFIDIIDDHILRDTAALAERFGAQGE